jgi:nicotinamidase-related amidase
MKTALLVIDVQQSFLKRPYWKEDESFAFFSKLQSLVDRARAREIPVLQIFHEEEPNTPDNPFSKVSGFVAALPQLRLEAQAVFHKNVHSALYGRAKDGRTLEQWLRDNQIEHVIVTGIRTEQCCETTTRHASDAGFKVTYAMDATLTFPMTAKSGRTYSAAEIRDRTELVLQDRFANVVAAEAVAL